MNSIAAIASDETRSKSRWEQYARFMRQLHENDAGASPAGHARAPAQVQSATDTLQVSSSKDWTKSIRRVNEPSQTSAARNVRTSDPAAAQKAQDSAKNAGSSQDGARFAVHQQWGETLVGRAATKAKQLLGP